MQDTQDTNLITDEIRSLLENIVDDLGVINYTITLTEGTQKGDNFLGIITRAKVRGRQTKTGDDVNLNFIIKSAPRQGLIRAVGPLRIAYEREIYVYNNIFPEFVNFQQEHCVKNHFASCAKFYKSSMAELNEVLIMEDMKSLGFELHKRSVPLNYDHALLVMREYGKLHALSFALRDQKPELFTKLTQNLDERFAKFWRDNHDINTNMKQQNGRILNAFDPVEDEVIYKRLQNFKDNSLEMLIPLLDAESAGEHSVINHGDTWIGNMLFKYDDSRKSPKPTQVCFLDWQLSRLGSPALDLSYFLFTSTDRKLRDEHYNHLIEEYYRSLSTFLSELGSNADNLFPFEVLQEHLKKFSMWGLLMAIMVIHIMVSETEEIPDVHSIEYEDSSTLSKFRFETKNSDKYNIRIRDVVLDFVKFNYDF